MATLAEFQQLGEKLEADIGGVATGIAALKTQIQALKDQLALGGMSADDETAAKELIAAKEAKLAEVAAALAAG